jgi:hypothetical protein
VAAVAVAMDTSSWSSGRKSLGIALVASNPIGQDIQSTNTIPQEITTAFAYSNHHHPLQLHATQVAQTRAQPIATNRTQLPKAVKGWPTLAQTPAQLWRRLLLLLLLLQEMLHLSIRGRLDGADVLFPGGVPYCAHARGVDHRHGLVPQ